MLFTLGHGQKIVESGPAPGGAPRTLAGAPRNASEEDAVPIDAVAPGTSAGAETPSLRAGAPETPPGGPFAYFFEYSDPVKAGPDAIAKLDALADAMVDQNPANPQNSKIPPVFTYLGQFIDHDITAQTDREAGASIIDPPPGEVLDPLPRSKVKSELHNLRNGSLGLDSLYGDGPNMDAFARKLQKLMRAPKHKGMMRLGLPTKIPGQRPPLPKDDACDLLRLGTLIQEGSLKKSEILGLPEPLRSSFVNADGEIIGQKAIIGDARNDENLIVAQLQVAFLRFHNRVVVWLQGRKGAPKTSDALFEKARELVRWNYQWLVVNSFLTRMCDPAVIDDVVHQEAKIYRNFLEKSCGGRHSDLLPLPLEFSAAAFRFGHSMVRGGYDHNRFFGRPGNFAPFASFEQLFLFTGNGADPLGGFPTLPSNWIIEWDRMINEPSAGFENRSARPIDTLLVPPLLDMLNQPAGVFKHLARRNLRRAHRLNIPSAQSCIRAINKLCEPNIKALTKEELTSGSTGQAVIDGGFDKATPLWFYVLKEAEIRGKGEHLGPLGSRLIAETLVGLVVSDPKSYWHQSGAKGRWHPRDGARPDGITVDSIPALMKAALLVD